VEAAPEAAEAAAEERALSLSDCVVYMGADKYENEGLIEWGHWTDIWFHVDKLSSAHVYLRCPLDAAPNCRCTAPCACYMDKIPEQTIEDMCQLVKNNSIEGCKKATCQIVYTPWSNLHKDLNTMQTGAVGFHNPKLRRLRRCDKDRDIVKRVEKTKAEKFPDLQGERGVHDKERKQAIQKAVKEEREAQEALGKAVGDAKTKAVREREEFLAAGGYHAPLAARQDDAVPPTPPSAAARGSSSSSGSSNSSSSSSSKGALDQSYLTKSRTKAAAASYGGATDGSSGLESALDQLDALGDAPNYAAKKVKPAAGAAAGQRGGGKGGGAGADSDGPPKPVVVTWETQAASRAQEDHSGDSDLAWLRARGYRAGIARPALMRALEKAKEAGGSGDDDDGGGGGGDRLAPRLVALAELYRAAVAEAAAAAGEEEPPPPPDPAEAEWDEAERAAAERAEEREALEAIFAPEEFSFFNPDDAQALDVAVAVVGYEQPEGAPRLELEVYAECGVAPLYPGAEPPVLALVGGGLLEGSLRRVGAALGRHAHASLENGPLVFELASLAGEEAAVAMQAENKAAKAKAKAAAEAARPPTRASLLGIKKPAAGEGEAAGGADGKPALTEEEKAVRRAINQARRAADAKARMGTFAATAGGTNAKTGPGKGLVVGSGGNGVDVWEDDDDDYEMPAGRDGEFDDFL
jgi:hypothetical protein